MQLVANGAENTIIQGEGRFLDLNFSIRSYGKQGSALCSDLTLERVDFYDQSGALLHAALSSGRICIGDEGLMGDVNADTNIREDDAQDILDITVGKIPVTPYHYMVGDLNGDVRLDSADAVVLLRMLAGASINPEDEVDYAAYESTRHLLLHDQTVKKGARFTLPIRLSDCSGLAGGEFSLAWSDEALRFESLRLVGPFSDWNYMVTAEAGQLSLSFAGLETGAAWAEEAIAEVTFTAVGPVTDSESPAAQLRLTHADLVLPYGERFLWFGDITLGQAEITIEDTKDCRMPICGAGVEANQKNGGNLLIFACLVLCLLLWQGRSERVRQQ